MVTIDIQQAQARLPRLIRRVELGEEIIITRAGRPVARLVALKTSVAARKPGSAKGQFKVSPNFDAPYAARVPTAFRMNVPPTVRPLGVDRLV
jgi:prevent-host-death family protein